MNVQLRDIQTKLDAERQRAAVVAGDHRYTAEYRKKSSTEILTAAYSEARAKVQRLIAESEKAIVDARKAYVSGIESAEASMDQARLSTAFTEGQVAAQTATSVGQIRRRLERAKETRDIYQLRALVSITLPLLVNGNMDSDKRREFNVMLVEAEEVLASFASPAVLAAADALAAAESEHTDLLSWVSSMALRAEWAGKPAIIATPDYGFFAVPAKGDDRIVLRSGSDWLN